MKKWDLPKGKLDKGETIKECAKREVEEETKVKVECGVKSFLHGIHILEIKIYS